MRLIKKEKLKGVQMEGEEVLQSINHISISLPSPYPLSLCTLVPPDLTHTHILTHTEAQSNKM